MDLQKMALEVFLHLLIFENLSDLLEEMGRTKLNLLLLKEAVPNSISLFDSQVAECFQACINQGYH
jgi:hypothetical protein